MVRSQKPADHQPPQPVNTYFLPPGILGKIIQVAIPLHTVVTDNIVALLPDSACRCLALSADPYSCHCHKSQYHDRILSQFYQEIHNDCQRQSRFYQTAQQKGNASAE